MKFASASILALTAAVVSTLSSESFAFIAVTPLRAVGRTASSSSSFLPYKPQTKLRYESGGDDNFHDKLSSAYDDWCVRYGHPVEPARKEIFSYHYLLAERVSIVRKCF